MCVCVGGVITPPMSQPIPFSDLSSLLDQAERSINEAMWARQDWMRRATPDERAARLKADREWRVKHEQEWKRVRGTML